LAHGTKKNNAIQGGQPTSRARRAVIVIPIQRNGMVHSPKRSSIHTDADRIGFMSTVIP
jgi:hypothetical protein